VAALVEGHVQIHAQARDGGAFQRICGAGWQCRKRCSAPERAGEELAFGPVQLERKGELVPATPTRRPAQGYTSGEIVSAEA